MPSCLAIDQLSPAALAGESNETHTLQASFEVSYRFPVVFTSNVFDLDNPVLAQTLCLQETDKQHRVLLFIEEAVAQCSPHLVEQWTRYAQHYSASIQCSGAAEIIPGGEHAKDDWHLQERLSACIENHAIDRHSFVVAIGGGAMLDAVGLAAATAHRGVRLIRLPTTVLAQNDAGIGVKNGINRFGQKNWYGTFAPPFAVINDDAFLHTLGPVDRRAGMAEAVKVALIRDAGFFNWIEANTTALAQFDIKAVRYLIERCAQLHLQQITQGGDPFERGTARPLDFGHWAAHRLEKMTQHRLGHGDAVALGIALDCRYAHLHGLLDNASLARIINVLKALGFPMTDPALIEEDDAGCCALLEGLNDFQRHLGGKLTITLLSRIGVGVEVHEMHAGTIEKAIRQMQTGDVV